MKRILFIPLFIVLSFVLKAQDYTINLEQSKTIKECTNTSVDGFTAKFCYSKILGYDVNTEKGTFTAIDIDGTYASGLEGEPQLLVERKMIAIPFGATPVVNIKSYTEEVYNLNDFGMHRVFPRQPSVSKSTKPEDIRFAYKESAYAQKGFVENEIANIEISGNVRGVRFGFINVRPIVYDASTNTIKVRNNIELEVTFKNANPYETQHLFEATYSPYFINFYNSLFNKDIYDEHPDLLQTPVHMIVIADRMFEEVMQP